MDPFLERAPSCDSAARRKNEKQSSSESDPLTLYVLFSVRFEKTSFRPHAPVR